jgi:DNA-binding GntR family transcriptional regulator
MADAYDPTKYKLVAAALRARIEDGTIALGQAVPLSELAAQTGWARRTCARGLQCLGEEGLVTRYSGLGYFVTARPGQGGQERERRPLPQDSADDACGHVLAVSQELRLDLGN